MDFWGVLLLCEGFLFTFNACSLLLIFVQGVLGHASAICCHMLPYVAVCCHMLP